MYQESLSQINPIEPERRSLFRGKMGKWLCRGCRQRGSMGDSTPYPILRKRREEVFEGDGSGGKAAAHLSSTPVLQQPLTLLLSPAKA